MLSIILNSMIPEDCVGSPTGAIDISVTGGAPPYSFYWTDGNGNPVATTEDISNVIHDSYTVFVTDAQGCHVSEIFDIPKGELPLLYDVIGEGCDITPGVTDHLHNAYIIVTPLSGTAPYTYNWTPPGGIPINNTLTGLDDGDLYNVTVVDASGCEGTIDDILVCSDQEIQLEANGQLISTFIDPFNPDVLTTFTESACLTYLEKIRQDDDEYIDAYNSYSGFTDWTIGEGYYVFMNYPGELLLEGSLICPEDNEIEWNPPTAPAIHDYFAYLRTETMPFANAIDPLALMVNGSEIIIVKDDGNQIYWASTSFTYSNFGDMSPGEGYDAIVPSTRTFFYPDNPNPQQGTKLMNTSTSVSNYEVMIDEEEFKTADYMFLGITEQAWDRLPNIGDEIGVYSTDGKLAGRIIFNGGHSAMVLYGQSYLNPEVDALKIGTPFIIKLWNSSTGRISLVEPTHWRLGDEYYQHAKISLIDSLRTDNFDMSDEGFNAYLFPNPTSGQLELNLVIPDDDNLTIQLIDIQGKKIKTLRNQYALKGEYSFRYNFDYLSDGFYFLNIASGQIYKNIKFIINK